jgi:predicted peptidase
VNQASTGIQSITPITTVYTYGQKVSAVAVEYGEEVDPDSLDTTTFSVQDTAYNFRFHPIEDLSKLTDRRVIHTYTNDAATTRADHRSVPGRYVVIELDPDDDAGWTVILSKYADSRWTVKVNPDLPTTVTQHRDVHGLRGSLLAGATREQARTMTRSARNEVVDDFRYGSHLSNGMVLPYHYHLPAAYDAERTYPLVVVLPGNGMGWDGDNLRVQLAADIPATAWVQNGEDVIVLAPQHQRVGAVAEAELLIDLLDHFTQDFAVDRRRVYATTVSYGSLLLWQAFAERPDLFAAGLVTGGYAADPGQAAAIAAAEIPVWITHGVHDHALDVNLARTSRSNLQDAYAERGTPPQQVDDLLKYVEYEDSAFSIPDYHAAFGPTYEDSSILQWVLNKIKPQP